MIELFEQRIRPSAIGAIALCPARPKMEALTIERMGAAPESPLAQGGTDLHARAREAIEHFKRGAEWGTAIATVCNAATAEGLNGWSVYCLQKSLEFVRDLVDTYQVDVDNILTEHALNVKFQGFTQNGTADVILVVPFKTVVVIDFKFGYADQGDAADHEQLSVYASAAADQFQCQEVFVWIAAPRGEKEHRFSGARFDRKTLMNQNAWVEAVIRQARADNPELCPGLVQCTYCEAKPKCQALKEWIMRLSEAVEYIAPPDSPDAWGEVAQAAKLAQSWGEEWKDKAKAHLIAQGPGSVTGFKLGAGRTLTSVSSVPEALKILNDAGMMSEVMPALKIAVGHLPIDGRKLIEHLVTEIPSAPSLIFDKRAKVTI